MIIPFKCDSVRVTSAYGKRVLNGASEFHSGYDMVGMDSTEVTAAVGGIVVQSQIVASGRTAEWGNYVCIRTVPLLLPPCFACGVERSASKCRRQDRRNGCNG